MFAGKKSAQIREILISESAWEEMTCLFAPSLVPDALIQAVAFYEQVKRENPPVETGAYKDAVEWVLREACRAVIKDE
ncbi:hypothetical protein CWN54_08870 [Klebsiella pneumoniae]|nr:hypothetical protein CWN54_08870 [Klebsiella pneumoniae]